MNKEAWIKIAKGAGIAALGAVLTYGLNTVVPFLNDHAIWGPAVASVLAVAINVVRKWIDSYGKEGA